MLPMKEMKGIKSHIILEAEEGASCKTLQIAENTLTGSCKKTCLCGKIIKEKSIFTGGTI